MAGIKIKMDKKKNKKNIFYSPTVDSNYPASQTQRSAV